MDETDSFESDPNKPTDRLTDQESSKNRPKTDGRIFPSNRLFIFSVTGAKPTDKRPAENQLCWKSLGRFYVGKAKNIGRFDEKIRPPVFMGECGIWQYLQLCRSSGRDNSAVWYNAMNQLNAVTKRINCMNRILWITFIHCR